MDLNLNLNRKQRYSRRIGDINDILILVLDLKLNLNRKIKNNKDESADHHHLCYS
jgi:hypothetical protein